VPSPGVPGPILTGFGAAATASGSRVKHDTKAQTGRDAPHTGAPHKFRPHPA
jgi:hypothetical protein